MMVTYCFKLGRRESGGDNLSHRPPGLTLHFKQSLGYLNTGKVSKYLLEKVDVKSQSEILQKLLVHL